MHMLLVVAALFAAAITMALSLAHVLEWPGKMRLDREQYLAMQKAYYPGFTYAGSCEPLTIILIALLVATTSIRAAEFGLFVAALITAATTHLFYWLLTAPINKAWVADEKLPAHARRFFGEGAGAGTADWISLRNRWERSHALRAISATFTFLLLAVAIAQH